jgi:hypothetical protein
VTWLVLLDEETELEEGCRVVVEVEPVLPEVVVEVEPELPEVVVVEAELPEVLVLVAVVAATDLVV